MKHSENTLVSARRLMFEVFPDVLHDLHVWSGSSSDRDPRAGDAAAVAATPSASSCQSLDHEHR